jgi:hypothetical protein
MPHPRTSDQRPCARGDRCRARTVTVVDGQRHATPAWSYRTFCDADRDHIARHLADLPLLYVRTHMELGTLSGGGERVSVSKTPPIPISQGVDALLCETRAVLLSWEERVRTVAHLTPVEARRRDSAAMAAACRILSAHLDALLALDSEPMLRTKTIPEAAKLPAGTPGVVRETAGYAEVILDLSGADAGAEILRLHARCSAVLADTKAPAKHLPVPCDGCGYADLYEVLTWDGRPDGAKCRECGYEYSDNEYTLLRGRVYAQEREREHLHQRKRLVSADYGQLSGRA